jgi:hypothetical protein
MYSHVMTILVAIAASPAAASSIETLSTIPLSNPKSVTNIHCTACVEHQKAAKPKTYNVPSLPDGQQRLVVGVRNGKPALMRTEAWMGGSPVTFVSVNPAFIENEQNAIAGRTGAPLRSDGVDLQATTSAVPPTKTIDPASVAPIEASTGAPDFSGIELRPSR